LLKLGRLRTRAGRLFVPGLSLKGNGTTTTSQASQITERLFVVDGPPFLEGLGDGGVIGGIEGLGAPQDGPAFFHLVCDKVARFEVKCHADFARNGDLAFAGESAGLLHSLLFT